MTIAQQIKWNFAKEGDLVIRNAKGNHIYYENSDGYWYKREFDEKGNVIYHENSNGFWYKCAYDEKGNLIYYETSNGFWYKCAYDEKGNSIYYETSDGYWSKREYDEKRNPIYYETSDGVIEDNRPKCENKVVDQKTSIDWLQKQIKLSAFVDRTQGFTYLDTEILFEMLAKAKQMEKEQIIEAATRWKGTDFAEQYYNETYGGQGSPDTSPNTQNK